MMQLEQKKLDVVIDSLIYFDSWLILKIMTKNLSEHVASQKL